MTNETLNPAEEEGVDKASQHKKMPVSEQVGITLLLNEVSRRLSAIELSLSKPSDSAPSKPSLTIDILKVLLGGWPAFGFIFLILFYFPLRDALNAIPAKVNSAAEIGIMGISLKATIQGEAEKLGSGYLSGTIPNLTTAELKSLLLQPQSGYSGLIITTGEYGTQLTTGVYFPTKETIGAFTELKHKGLIELTGDWKETSHETYEIIEKFKSNHPGTTKTGDSNANQLWALSKPENTLHDLPSLTWHTTPLGKKAIEIIVQSVAKQLNP